MARRGRPSKPEADRKSEPISIRLTPGLRDRLEKERTKVEPPQTLSQEIEARIRESFELDGSIHQFLGGYDYHYWLLRVIAELIVLIEHELGRKFVNDRFTFDQVKLAINTILDRFEPGGISSPPELLTRILDEQSINELGKVQALMSLVGIELAPRHGKNMHVLEDFVNPILASKHLAPLIRKPVIKELNEIWLRKQTLKEDPQ